MPGIEVVKGTVSELFFFQNCRNSFVYSAKNKNRRGDQIPPKKALFVGEKGRQFCLGAKSHDRAIVIQSATALKAENWLGQEGV